MSTTAKNISRGLYGSRGTPLKPHSFLFSRMSLFFPILSSRPLSAKFIPLPILKTSLAATHIRSLSFKPNQKDKETFFSNPKPYVIDTLDTLYKRRIIIKPGALPGLHFLSCAESGDHLTEDKNTEMVYQFSKNGKLYYKVFQRTAFLNLKETIHKIENLKTHAELSSPLKEECMLLLVSKYLDREKIDILIKNRFWLLNDRLYLYNYLVTEEPYSTYRKQIFRKYSAFLGGFHSKDAEFMKTFTKSIDEGQPDVKSLQTYFEEVGYSFSKPLIERLANLKDTDIFEKSNDNALLISAQFLKKTLSKEAILTKTNHPLVLKQYKQFVQTHMPFNSKSPVEFSNMRNLRALYLSILTLDRTFGEWQDYQYDAILLNILSQKHPKITWKEEYEHFRTICTHLNRDEFTHDLNDAVSAFAKQVVLPYFVRNKLLQNIFDNRTFFIHTVLYLLILRILSSDMKLEQLIKLSKVWHENREHLNAKIITYMEPAKLAVREWPALTLNCVTPKRYQIICLASREALEEEGRILKHCVGSYYISCMAGLTHIYSVLDPKGDKIATAQLAIEKSGKRVRVIQQRGVGNSPPELDVRIALNWFVTEINEGRIKINMDEIDEFQKNKKQEEQDYRSFIGFDPNDTLHCQTVFELYHPIFVRKKSIKTPQEYIKIFNLIESVDKLRQEPEHRVRR